jgi:hypothetical protein
MLNYLSNSTRPSKVVRSLGTVVQRKELVSIIVIVSKVILVIIENITLVSFSKFAVLLTA